MKKSKRCPRCEKRKPVTSFGKDRHRPDGRRAFCLPCMREYVRLKRKVKKPSKCPICSRPTSGGGRVCSACRKSLADLMRWIHKNPPTSEERLTAEREERMRSRATIASHHMRYCK